MAIAEMPCDPNQMLRVAATDLHERLRRGHDLDQPAIFEHQCVAAPQRDRGFEIEQKRQAARPRHRHPAAVSIVEIKHDRIGRRFDPAMLSTNFDSTDHHCQYMK
jgi:hypothetical protein